MHRLRGRRAGRIAASLELPLGVILACSRLAVPLKGKGAELLGDVHGGLLLVCPLAVGWVDTLGNQLTGSLGSGTGFG